MATHHSKNVRIYFKEFNQSGYSNDVAVELNMTLHDVTVHTSTAETFAAGLVTGKITVKALFDTATGASEPEYWESLDGSAGALTIGWQNAENGRAIVASVREATFKIGAPVNGMVTIEMTFQVDGGAYSGVEAHELSAETGATNGSSYDHGAGSTGSNGFIQNLHVTAFSGTSITVKSQDSADDSAWADVTASSFTAATGATSQTLTGTTSVRRYTRSAWTGTITSATFEHGFAKKP